MTAAPTADAIATPRRLLTRFGPFVVVLALAIATASFLIFSDYTPLAPTDNVVLGLFIANITTILLLVALVVVEGWAIVGAWRAGAAGARLHLRVVGLFSIIAAAPVILMALVGSVTLDRSLNPAFMQDVRGFVLNTIEAARLFREGQCRSLLQEARLTALDLDRGKVMFTADRSLFKEYFASRAKFLGFSAAALMKPDGTMIERVDMGPTGGTGTAIIKPADTDFADAKKNEPLCLLLDEGRTFVALRPMASFPDTYLYAARPVDSFTIEFPKEANRLVVLYDAFDGHRRSISIAFATMYVSIALIMLLSATWLGLNFANRLVEPIRRLIGATDQVASGNLFVQVAVHRSEGDLAHLGETFNKMTSELRLQQNRLVAASTLIDERRIFTEAVLSGVPVAVVGVGPAGEITTLNPSAEQLIPKTGEGAHDIVGQKVETVMPEIATVLAEARASQHRLVQGQVSINRNGRDRLFNVRVTSEPSVRADKSYVMTLDDISDVIDAQRTAAWADVARRIAHEIKNPLTPIQLSAERLKRKYGRNITVDQDIFYQCTDTIVRQVDDIKRMVDEFSSFARMPKATLERDDLSECVRRVLFLMRVAQPEMTFEERLPPEPVFMQFDRRLISQALTNIIKNATEGILASDPMPDGGGRVLVSLIVGGNVELNIIDNGKGFPVENRQRLLEPYMTTRAEGTGLGLPIVAKILEDHGGGLELLDAPGGQGARVRLFFPNREASPGASPSDEPALAAATETA
ncbi:PAS domain-containing sensor histidine kinase [Beijerinckia sp. L45]|uniref:sensor histidine kinase NtrY-like n=1 Tax=Beijerinckia sp. L45 TaxID=1641855 RepID=UPI00131D136C|nr:PAS domain-containing sensor histidine kinase [Beijerinckia sp. L45]